MIRKAWLWIVVGAAMVLAFVASGISGSINLERMRRMIRKRLEEDRDDHAKQNELAKKAATAALAASVDDANRRANDAARNDAARAIADATRTR